MLYAIYFFIFGSRRVNHDELRHSSFRIRGCVEITEIYTYTLKAVQFIQSPLLNMLIHSCNTWL